MNIWAKVIIFTFLKFLFIIYQEAIYSWDWMVKIKAMERVKRPGIFLILWVDSCYTMTSKHRHCFFKGETVLLTCYQWTADQSQGCLSKLGSIPERSLIKIAGVKKATANKTSERIWKMLLVPYSLQIV